VLTFKQGTENKVTRKIMTFYSYSVGIKQERFISLFFLEMLCNKLSRQLNGVM